MACLDPAMCSAIRYKRHGRVYTWAYIDISEPSHLCRTLSRITEFLGCAGIESASAFVGAGGDKGEETRERRDDGGRDERKCIIYSSMIGCSILICYVQ